MTYTEADVVATSNCEEHLVVQMTGTSRGK